jgi:type IV pilus secretin PilQ/predicted competence protein
MGLEARIFGECRPFAPRPEKADLQRESRIPERFVSQNCEPLAALARIVLRELSSMKISALTLKNMNRTLSALILTTSAVFAQDPAAPGTPATPASPAVPAALEPPTTPATPAVPPPAGVAPTVIDPPVTNPGAAPLPGAAPGVPNDANTPRVSEFQGDDVGLVLRTLARQAGMSVVVSAQVTGPITLRLENKTPREVIKVVCNANGLVMDELDGVTYIKTQAEKAKEPTETYQYTFSYASAEKIVPLLQTQLSSNLLPQFDTRTNTVFYRDTKSNIDKVKVFLQSVDQPTKQVMIEARLVEVNANPKQSYGINWGGVLGGSANPLQVRYGGSNVNDSAIGITSANGVTQKQGSFVNSADNQPPQNAFGSTGNILRDASNIGNLGKGVLGQFAILSLPQLSATLRLLNEDADAEFLANPRIVAANNQKAVIKITRAQPVPQLNFNEQTAQAVFSGFQDKEFGNSLTVTPSINKDNFITLAVQPEISNKVGDATFTFSGATVFSPIIDKRTFDSNVLIKSGDTLAIGGLLQDEVSKGRAKVPVLGDVPLFGYFFQERVNSRTKRNLLVFVTPTIVKSGYGTGLESQVSGLTHVGEEFADPNGWRNNAKGAIRIVPTSNRQVASEVPKPGIPPAPKGARTRYKVNASARD